MGRKKKLSVLNVEVLALVLDHVINSEEVEAVLVDQYPEFVVFDEKSTFSSVPTDPTTPVRRRRQRVTANRTDPTVNVVTSVHDYRSCSPSTANVTSTGSLLLLTSWTSS
jgi:hypothetical protein